ncbi:MAG: NAD+ diphosphatase NudC [Phormidesmis priestleyi Ana]|uniref:NAD-capped RNA hydrolase NudC n=1 Tax=Phormidesmis priestleyi Ana TaxID=1666911 RepID=A0A0P7Z0G9_9CYAN|nr:MAG: NAD+ diphosphatase NudC [Phormidesmis priestleyi Ana]
MPQQLPIVQQPFALSTAFVPATAPHHKTNPPLQTWWFICQESHILTIATQANSSETMGAMGYSLPQSPTLEALGIMPVRTQFLGYLANQPCIAAEVADGFEPADGFEFESLRSLHTQLPEDLFAIAARAVQITAWDRTHQYCGQCATPMIQLPSDRAKHCPNCNLRQYPRLSPAVIMLIYKGEQLLLARAPRFRNGMYSVLAGFVEPGESLEETVARETREEVGLEIKNIRYFGSQPWPFPNSLMIGFTAEYASGDITPEPSEIEAAAWFDKTALPPVPGKLSIARKLIDWFVSQ